MQLIGMPILVHRKLCDHFSVTESAQTESHEWSKMNGQPKKLNGWQLSSSTSLPTKMEHLELNAVIGYAGECHQCSNDA